MPSVKIHVEKFEAMIARRGRPVKWEQSVLCTCWNLQSGQPNYYCNACGGKGYTYEPPVDEVGLVMSITQNKDFDESAGVFQIGDAVLTVPKRVFKVFAHPTNTSGVDTLIYERENAMFDIGMNDRITLMDDDFKTSELLKKGEDIDMRPADTLLNRDVVSIISIRSNNPETGEITKYEPEVDFTHDENRIVWLLPSQPADGTQYSVTYTHRPVFTVLLNLPKPRYQDKQDLPRYVALRYRAGGFDPK